jgi:hypothetical protein
MSAQDGTGNQSPDLQPPQQYPTPLPEKPVGTDPPYSVFTHGEKWLIVNIASFAALFRLVGSYMLTWS